MKYIQHEWKLIKLLVLFSRLEQRIKETNTDSLFRINSKQTKNKLDLNIIKYDIKPYTHTWHKLLYER